MYVRLEYLHLNIPVGFTLFLFLLSKHYLIGGERVASRTK